MKVYFSQAYLSLDGTSYCGEAPIEMATYMNLYTSRAFIIKNYTRLIVYILRSYIVQSKSEKFKINFSAKKEIFITLYIHRNTS
jgi:hypothetical protein